MAPDASAAAIADLQDQLATCRAQVREGGRAVASEGRAHPQPPTQPLRTRHPPSLPRVQAEAAAISAEQASQAMEAR